MGIPKGVKQLQKQAQPQLERRFLRNVGKLTIVAAVLCTLFTLLHIYNAWQWHFVGTVTLTLV